MYLPQYSRDGGCRKVDQTSHKIVDADCGCASLRLHIRNEWGCFALSLKVESAVVRLIRGNTVLVGYYPDPIERSINHDITTR